MARTVPARGWPRCPNAVPSHHGSTYLFTSGSYWREDECSKALAGNQKTRPPRGPSAHQPVAVRPPDRLALGKAGETKRGEVRMPTRALDEEGGHHPADRRRELEAVAREAHRHVEPLRPHPVQNRMPVRCHVEATGVSAGDGPLLENRKPVADAGQRVG